MGTEAPGEPDEDLSLKIVGVEALQMVLNLNSSGDGEVKDDWKVREPGVNRKLERKSELKECSMPW